MSNKICIFCLRKTINSKHLNFFTPSLWLQTGCQALPSKQNTSHHHHFPYAHQPNTHTLTSCHHPDESWPKPSRMDPTLYHKSPYSGVPVRWGQLLQSTSVFGCQKYSNPHLSPYVVLGRAVQILTVYFGTISATGFM